MRSDLSGTTKVVFAILIDASNEKNVVSIGVRKIADKAGVTVETVCAATRKLVEIGLLKLVAGRTGQRNAYQVLTAQKIRAPKKSERSEKPNGTARKTRAQAPKESEHVSSKKKRQEESASTSITYDREKISFVGISDGDRKRWTEKFPSVHIDDQLEKAAAWVSDNKTPKNIRLFLHNWLERDAKRTSADGTGGNGPPEPYSEEWWALREPELEETFDKPAKLGKYAERANP